MSLRNDPRAYWFVAVLYATGIFLLSASPQPPEPAVISALPYSDKIAHFFLYLLFGAILYTAALKSDFSPRKSGEMSFFIGTFYAFTDEIHQSFVPGRSCDAADFLTDVIAILVAVVLLWKWRKL